MKKFKPSELFAVNEELNIKKIKLDDDDLILMIDDFYKNPDDIREFILNTPAPIWKNTPDSLNFKQYYDCRHNMSCWDTFPFVLPLSNIMSYYYDFILNKERQIYFITNVFQWIENQPNEAVGNRVHTDGHREFASNVYFNKGSECNGGTAIYRSKHTDSIRLEEGEEWIGEIEDGSCYYDKNWTNDWTLELVIPMKYNRCVMHPGYLYHGAYHTDNAFKDFPRIAQICFIESEFDLKPKK